MAASRSTPRSPIRASVERLVLIGATAGIDDDDERADRRRADELLADHIEAIGVEAFIDEWLSTPLFARLTPSNDQRGDRLRNTAAGLASSLRSTGTGTQTPLWDRLGEIEAPVLVLVGEEDAKFRALGERLVSQLPRSELACDCRRRPQRPSRGAGRDRRRRRPMARGHDGSVAGRADVNWLASRQAGLTTHSTGRARIAERRRVSAPEHEADRRGQPERELQPAGRTEHGDEIAAGWRRASTARTGADRQRDGDEGEQHRHAPHRGDDAQREARP